MITRLFVFFMLAFCVPAFAEVPQSRAEMQLSFAPLVKKAGPAVVNIYAKRLVRERMRVISPFFNDPFFNQFFNTPHFGGTVRERVENSLGSGVIVDSTGIIATNNHVIKDATEINVVMSDGREFSATKLLVDSKTDLAVLKIETKGEALPFLELTDSDAVAVGDLVLAVGNPFGIGQTVTSGIVSSEARTDVGITDYSFFIQTDAAINPGNSGGALVDMQGRLIGINTAIFSKSGGSLGIGFAVPANMLKTVIAAAKSGDKVVRPWSGLGAQAVTPDMVESLGLKKGYGALVTRVHPKSPAARAGIIVGDVILSINGKEIQDPQALKFRLATIDIGASIALVLQRKGEKKTVFMAAERAPEIPARDETQVKDNSPLSGAWVANISPAISEEMGGIAIDGGVIVTKAEEGYAPRIGVQKGDIILFIGDEKIESVKHLTKTLKNFKSRQFILRLLRGERELSLAITR